MMKGDTKHSMSLYRMEMRKNRSFVISLIALQILLIAAQLAVKFTQYKNGNSLDPFNIIPVSGLLLFGLFLSFPLMMLYSWFREEKDHTSYQALSFPIRGNEIIRNKLKVFFSIGVVWAVVSSISVAIRTILRVSQSSWAHYNFVSLLYHPFFFISRLALLMGFSCLIIGILQKIRKHRLLTGFGIIIAGVSVYILLNDLYQSIQMRLVDKYLRYGIQHISSHERLVTYTNGWLVQVVSNTLVLAFPLLIGIACMYTGFYLFDKYSEV